MQEMAIARGRSRTGFCNSQIVVNNTQPPWKRQNTVKRSYIGLLCGLHAACEPSWPLLCWPSNQIPRQAKYSLLRLAENKYTYFHLFYNEIEIVPAGVWEQSAVEWESDQCWVCLRILPGEELRPAPAQVDQACDADDHEGQQLGVGEVVLDLEIDKDNLPTVRKQKKIAENLLVVFSFQETEGATKIKILHCSPERPSWHCSNW